MTKHTVTVDDLSDFMENERRSWMSFASSAARGHETKSLEFSLGLTAPTYRVMSGKRTVYIGLLKESAVREYNNLP